MVDLLKTLKARVAQSAASLEAAKNAAEIENGAYLSKEWARYQEQEAELNGFRLAMRQLLSPAERDSIESLSNP